MANFSKPASLLTAFFTLFALLQFTVAFQHGSHHHAHAARSEAEIKAHLDELNAAIAKRQSSQGTIAITGVCSAGTNSNGQCNSGSTASPRLEVRVMAQNSDQFNLFLLGLERLQAKDKNDPLSYYRIAGVHGHPFVSWNNFPTPLVNQAGFCPHGSTMFAPWHRPFLAVFEVSPSDMEMS